MKGRRHLFSVVLAPCMLAASLASATGGANCFTVIVGREASASGAVLLAHNEDDRTPQIVNWLKVPHLHHAPGEVVRLKEGATLPQVPETAAYIWAQMPGQEFADSYMNEYGVTIVSNACRSKVVEPELSEGGIGYWLRRLMAERSRTAREAVALAGRLIERFGYHSSGRTYTIADPREAWMLSVVRGKLWVAERIPDDGVAVLANHYTIDRIDLEDTRSFMGSPELVPYATRHGWYDPERDGPFSFWKTYSNPRSAFSVYNVGRQWRGVTRLSGEDYSPGEELPFAFAPHPKIRLEELFDLLRDHFEGTQLQSARSYQHGNPHVGYVKRICSRSTQYGLVAELRNNLPAALGAVLWMAPRRPCIQPFVPIYSGIEAFPPGFARTGWRQALANQFREDPKRYTPVGTLAYWAFAARAAAIDGGYVRLAPHRRVRAARLEGAVLYARQRFEHRIAGEIRRRPTEVPAKLTRFSGDWLIKLWDLNRTE
ncbi:MAG: dipeptidase [Acidobacteria bacterium]|nr:dipeptidase [Acidobacteriota bacterium]